jgi:hypothetical protein
MERILIARCLHLQTPANAEVKEMFSRIKSANGEMGKLFFESKSANFEIEKMFSEIRSVNTKMTEIDFRKK